MSNYPRCAYKCITCLFMGECTLHSNENDYVQATMQQLQKRMKGNFIDSEKKKVQKILDKYVNMRMKL